MTTISKVSVMVVAAAIVGCRPSAQSSADTTAATSSSAIPAVTAGPSDSVSAAASLGQGGTKSAAGRSKTSTRGSTSVKPTVTSTRRNSNAAPDTGIIGRDSVIRFPHRGLPTASSTPIRK